MFESAWLKVCVCVFIWIIACKNNQIIFINGILFHMAWLGNTTPNAKMVRIHSECWCGMRKYRTLLFSCFLHVVALAPNMMHSMTCFINTNLHCAANKKNRIFTQLILTNIKVINLPWITHMDQSKLQNSHFIRVSHIRHFP